MARSMTGYGGGQATAGGLAVAVEVRGVNNRFLDIAFKLPKALSAHESDVRDIIRARINRGRISVFVSEEWTENLTSGVSYDRGKAAQYARALEQMRRELNLGGEVRLEHLLAVDNLFAAGEDDAYRSQLWALVSDALLQALDSFMTVSRREGKNLEHDLIARLAEVRREWEAVKILAAQQTSEYRDRLLARLEELMGDHRLDPTRLETEIALAADRLDISEEITRLGSHLDLFAQTLKNSDAVGKTLNFIVQEMGREVNTIGAKSWMVEISQASIRMKDILEQIREQVQNIE
ncbi:MAG: YicC/YloC family endoribonuclease [Calditrichota bacterium]